MERIFIKNDIWSSVCLYIYMYIYTWARMCVCIYIYIYIYIYACVCVCVFRGEWCPFVSIRVCVDFLILDRMFLHQ